MLFRINAQSEVFEEALAEAGIPYLLRGAERFFERPEVREALILLREPPGRRQRPRRRRDEAAEGPACWPIDLRAAARPGRCGRAAARRGWESLTALVGLAEELAAARPGRRWPTARRAHRAGRRAARSHGRGRHARLAARGQRAGVGRGPASRARRRHVPISYATTPAAVEEERRLLYVGVTRAREHLHLSWASARSPGGRASRQPSRFLDGVRLA